MSLPLLCDILHSSHTKKSYLIIVIDIRNKLPYSLLNLWPQKAHNAHKKPNKPFVNFAA